MSDRDVPSHFVGAFFMLIVITISGALPLNVLMAFPNEQESVLTKGLKRTLAEVSRGGRINASFTLLENAGEPIIRDLCSVIEQENPSLLLSFLPKDMSFFAAMVAGTAAVPFMSLTRNYTDVAAQQMSPWHLSLDPKPEDLADALFLFLASQDWYEVSLLLDGSTMSLKVSRRLKTLSNGRDLLRVIQLGTTTPEMILSALSDAQVVRQRILLLCCSGESKAAPLVFQVANRLGMLSGDWIWILLEGFVFNADLRDYPIGLLGLRLRRLVTSRHSVRAALDVVSEGVRYLEGNDWLRSIQDKVQINCWENASDSRKQLSDALHTVIRRQMERESPVSREGLEPPVFDILNLIPGSPAKRRWKRIGNVTGSKVSMDAIVWMRPDKRYRLWGLDHSFQVRRQRTRQGLRRYRVATAYSPPFVKPGTRVANGSCLIGVPCLKISTKSPHDIAAIFADYTAGRSEGDLYNVSCCAGVSIDLLHTLSYDLNFDYDLYLVADGLFGTVRNGTWNGITADLVSGAADLTLTAFSMTSTRQRVIDFSVPYFHSGVSCLTSSQYKEVPLSAFLVPFSIQLWIAIFAGLTTTAIAAAIYEWLSPFGLNPWGRQRTKNFSLASALWVMWSLLFSHLVAFKAPKSWPNKVLINVWGCFSVIFLASYTANIAALFAGLFFHLRVDDFHDASLLHVKTGTARGSAAEGYVFAENPELWQHIQKYGVDTLEEGLEQLRRKELDVLIGDTAVLNYFRGNDPGCNLHLLGDSIFDDAYAVGAKRGFPLMNEISQLLLRYNEYGYLDQLQKKWYGRVPCFDDRLHRFNQPEPLSVSAVAGVFIMLLVGILIGTIILAMEHLVFKYALPVLRQKPKDCLWRSPNLMFFSQKLYRFINTVELVSPHHSAKEIVSNLREGQIASLFQKSVKKKFKEEARRRKSKSQFFDMIQEIRRVVKQQNEPRILTWEDSRQTLASPQGANDVLVVSKDIKEDGEDDAEEDDDDSASSEERSYPHFRPPFIVHSTRPGRTSYRFESPAYSCTSSESVSMSQAKKRAEQLRGCSSTGDIPSATNFKEDEDFWETAETAWPKVRSLEDLRSLRKGSFESDRQRVTTTESGDSLSITWQWAQAMDELRLVSMTKEEIVKLWQGSERALLNRLQDTLREKRILEEKLAFIQKTLLKPP